MNSTIGIDWLAATLPTPPSGDSTRSVRFWGANTFNVPSQQWLMEKGRFGYPYSLREPDSGITVYYGGAVEMGIHYVLPGAACRNGRAEHILRLAHTAWHKFSRIDIAWDIHDGLLVSDLADAVERGALVTSARGWSLLTGTSGSTLYIGSRASERYLRCYDKRAEQGLTSGPAWTRLELECKGHQAAAIAGALVMHGLSIIPSIIAAYASWPDLDQWRLAYDAVHVGVSLEPTRRKIHDTERWLADVVAPAIAARCRANPAFLSEFIELVKTRM